MRKTSCKWASCIAVGPISIWSSTRGGTGRGRERPLLPVLRYKPAAMEKRRAWERTWELQRQEDAIDARTQASLGPSRLHPRNIAGRAGEKQSAGRRDSRAARNTTAPTSRRRPTGDCVASSMCPRNAGSASRIARAKTQAWSLPGQATTISNWLRPLARTMLRPRRRVAPRTHARAALGLHPGTRALAQAMAQRLRPGLQPRMGDYYAGFVEGEAKELEMTVQQIRDWKPPQQASRRGRRSIETAVVRTR